MAKKLPQPFHEMAKIKSLSERHKNQMVKARQYIRNIPSRNKTKTDGNGIFYFYKSFVHSLNN